jgi:hypothetical protein
MEQQHSPQGGSPNRLPETPRWPKYIGALALAAWLTRVAAYESPEPSVELFIAQYPGEEIEQSSTKAHIGNSFQLPLHLQWGAESVPSDLCERPLTPADLEATRRIQATAVNIFAGRTALFALYGRLEPRTYAALATRLSTGVRLPAHAELTSVHGQYVARGVIEACGTVSTGATVRALATRLERRRRRWMGTELRLV